MAGTMVAYRWTPGSADELMDQADRLMEIALRMEREDPSISDSTVSVDALLGIISFEVYSRRGDVDAAERRVKSALDEAGLGLGEPLAAQPFGERPTPNQNSIRWAVAV